MENTMATLMGKYKNEEWKELDHTDEDSDFPIDEQKDYLKNEYQIALGQGWMFKWEDSQ
tara:strand:- start:205 stop:381 length:177 start_codon:yes stop_codon:yes gene_type:complete